MVQISGGFQTRHRRAEDRAVHGINYSKNFCNCRRQLISLIFLSPQFSAGGFILGDDFGFTERNVICQAEYIPPGECAYCSQTQLDLYMNLDHIIFSAPT